MKCLLIGGLTNNKNNIENFLINLIPNPDILYIALATDKYEYSYNLFKNKIKTNISILTRKNITNLDYESLFNKANILFFAGGNTKELLEYVKKYNLDKYFTEDKILVGVSAGAIMLASYGMGDADSFIDCGQYFNFKMIKGLGIIDICFCPHYQKEELVLFDDECKKYGLDSYALEDDTAIYFEDGRLSKVIKNEKRNSVYYLANNEYILIPLYERQLY